MLLLVHELEIQKKNKSKEKNLRNNTEYKGYMWKQSNSTKR